MKNAPSIQFYPRDYLADADVRMLNFAQRGIYMDLICYCWERDGLPKEQDKLAKLLNLSRKEAAELLPEVMRLFLETDGGYHHGRLLEQKDIYAERRAKAQASIAKRWYVRNTAEEDPSNTNVLRTYYDSNTRAGARVAEAEAVAVEEAKQLITSPAPAPAKTRRRKSSAEELGEDMPDFVRFWACYPRHDDRVGAAAAWRRMNPDAATVERIITYAVGKAMTEDWRKEGGKYIPMPTTYLNRKRWLDTAPTVKPLESDRNTSAVDADTYLDFREALRDD